MKTIKGSYVKVLVALCIFWAIAESPCWGQGGELFHKPVPVVLHHAPQLALAGVTKIIVMDFNGDCGPELTDRLRQALENSKKFELMDRANLDAILKEHNFQLSGEVNSSTIASMGQFMGATALITGRVNRCNVDTSELLKSGYPYTDRYGTHQRYSVKTKAYINANIQLIDLTTSKIYKSMSFDTPEAAVENYAIDNRPEAPDKDEVKTRAYGLIIQKFSHVILPWSEVQNVYFFHDDKLSVSKSVELVRTSNYERAISMLKTAIDEYEKSDKVDSKLLSKAYYNLGMCRIVLGQRKEGLTDLEKSNDLHHSDFAVNSIQLCTRMMQEDAKFKAQETTSVEIGPKAGTSDSSSSQEVITNDDIIAMAQAKMSDSLIVSKIKTSKANFDVTTKGMLRLKNAGVSDAVIEVMTQRSH